MVQLLVASRNPKKLTELRRVLDQAAVAGIDIVGLDEVPAFDAAPETGATFTENALAKAREGAVATGLPCVADDSGLAVDALHGMPGVLSARWCGRHGDDAANNALLLAQLADVPDECRGARFVSACALVCAGREIVVTGEWSGRIVRKPVGDNGFGYDPLFIPDGGDVTSAQLSPQEKDALSHRGRALRALLPALAELARQ